ncbi:hypothetical protein [Phytohalomonas tamaricis]|uniref:hypothetical protein n=1 Tax=Phytohalomonas tamaricis TaxID=2081032 RepID=UPI000D0B45C1|nr:hypothetical protein [Phytohalomonas tamaricis]
MTVALVWIIAFAIFFFLALKGWEGGFGHFVKSRIPAALQVDDNDRWLWSAAVGVLGATLIIRPVSMILTLILIAIIAFVVKLVMTWALKKIH